MVVAERLSHDAKQVVARAENLAVRYGHAEVDTYHLLMALVENPGLAAVLRKAGTNPEHVRDSIIAAHPDGSVTGVAHRPYSRAAKRALDIALRSMMSRGARTITPEHIFLGVVIADDAAAELALIVDGSLAEARSALADQLPGVASLVDLTAPRCPTCDERLDVTLRSRAMTAPAENEGGPSVEVVIVFCDGCRHVFATKLADA